jgi:hypothetical protein
VTVNIGDLTPDDLRKFLTTAEFEELMEAMADEAQHRVFWPTPKQLEVVNSKADIVGYGGAAGGGKSYLIAGLSVSEHTRSAIIRPQKNQTRKFVQELTKMLKTRSGYSSLEGWTLRTPDGKDRFINFFGLDNPGDEEKQQGDDYDLKAYDEVTQMREQDVRYTLTWNRSDIVGQRVRAVLAFNPPTTPEGRWVVKFFAPWLDKMHQNPAKDGELRWFATVGDEQDYEVSGPQPFIIKYVDGRPQPWYNIPPGTRPEEIIQPKSRTFIHALVTDNPYYMATGYMAQLQALPEPLRSQMLKGDFSAGQQDDANQLIPTAWIDAAMERGKEQAAQIAAGTLFPGPQDSIGCDVARGGNMGSTTGATGHDELVISKRYGSYFAPLVVHKGVAIDDGAKSAALIIGERRDEAPVHVDVVGVGTSTYDFLCQNNIHSIPVNGSAQAGGTAKGEMPLRFGNLRAELHWRLREALDPANPEPIALPFDQQMAVDLAAPRWSLGKNGIMIEPKENIIKRLGRSPDRGDAVVLANIVTPKRQMIIGGYLDAGPHMGESYERRRLRELEGN